VFFALSLLLPVVAAVLGHFLERLGFLEFFAEVGGIPYLLVAIILATFILRARSFRRLIVLSAVAPLAFGLALAIFVMVVGNVPEAHLTMRQYASQFMSMAGMGIFFSGFYVGIAWGLWALGRKLRWVVIEFTASRIE
jgi:hypothetical protein